MYGKEWKKGKVGFWFLLHISHIFSLDYLKNPFQITLSIFCFPTPLHLIFFSNVSFLLISPLIIFHFLFPIFFLFAIPNFHHQSPNCWMQISIWKNIFLYYDIDNRVHTPTTEVVIFTFTLQFNLFFFYQIQYAMSFFYLSSSHWANTGRVLHHRMHQHPWKFKCSVWLWKSAWVSERMGQNKHIGFIYFCL